MNFPSPNLFRSSRAAEVFPTLKNFNVLIVLLFLFGFSDMYYFGVGRPFDYFSTVLVLYFFRKNNFCIANIVLPALAFSLVAPWLFVGIFFNDSFLAAMAITLGWLIFLPFGVFAASGSIQRECFEQSVYLIVVLLFSVLFLDCIAFYGFGTFVDLTGSLGSIKSRGWNEGLGWFRPSGFFQEPNAYCTIMFCLLSMCQFFTRRLPAVEIAGLLSIIVTESLWGFGAAVVLIYLLFGFRCLILLVLLCLSVSTVFVILFNDSWDTFVQSSVTLSRVFNIENDPSRQARFGSIDSINLGAYSWWIGHGLDTKNFNELAANGIAFSLYCFGVIGSLILAVLFLCASKLKSRVLLPVFFLLTTFPPFSYMYFWCWFGCLLGLNKCKLQNASSN